MDNAKKNIKRSILNTFRSFENTGHEILPASWIFNQTKGLNMHEKEFFYRAIEELIQAGIVEKAVAGKGLYPGLKLTRKGENLIYFA